MSESNNNETLEDMYAKIFTNLSTSGCDKIVKKVKPVMRNPGN